LPPASLAPGYPCRFRRRIRCPRTGPRLLVSDGRSLSLRPTAGAPGSSGFHRRSLRLSGTRGFRHGTVLPDPPARPKPGGGTGVPRRGALRPSHRERITSGWLAPPIRHNAPPDGAPRRPVRAGWPVVRPAFTSLAKRAASSSLRGRSPAQRGSAHRRSPFGSRRIWRLSPDLRPVHRPRLGCPSDKAFRPNQADPLRADNRPSSTREAG